MTRHKHLVKTKLLKNIQGFTKHIQGLMGGIGTPMYVSSGVKWFWNCAFPIHSPKVLSYRLMLGIVGLRNVQHYADKRQNIVSSVRSGSACFCTLGNFSATYSL